MKSSKIYCQINTDRKGDKSFGCDEFLKQDILVGTSAKNSCKLVTIKAEVYPTEVGYRFEFKVNDIVLEKCYFNKTTKRFRSVSVTLNELMDVIAGGKK